MTVLNRSYFLSTNAEFLDKLVMPVGVDLAKVLHQAATLGYLAEKAAAGAIVFLVDLQVLSEFTDALGKECNLDFRRAGITLTAGVFLDDFGFSFFIDDGHGVSSKCSRRGGQCPLCLKFKEEVPGHKVGGL